MDGSMAVVKSCCVSSRLESWFEIIHVKPPNMLKSQSWSFSLSELWKKKSIPSPIPLNWLVNKYVHQFMNRAHVTDHGSQSTFKHFPRNLFSVTKKDHVRQKVHQWSFNPPLKKKHSTKNCLLPSFTNKKRKFKPKNPQATQPFFWEGSIPGV